MIRGTTHVRRRAAHSVDLSPTRALTLPYGRAYRIKIVRRTNSEGIPLDSTLSSVSHLHRLSVHNIAAKRLVGISIDPDEFENRYMNAVMLIMNDIKKGVRPRKLSSYCYLRVFKFLYDPINQFYDSQTTMDFSDKENEYVIAKSLGVSRPL